MAVQNLLGDLSLESTQQELLGACVFLLAAMMEKMPRVTGNDQCAVSVEGGTVTVSGSLTSAGTISNVTGYLGDLRAVGTQFTSGANIMLSGTQHIYSNIQVS